jgi:osmotically inducible lipoprotein OsmB
MLSLTKPVSLAMLVVAALTISACGTTTGDRAASGGLLGAGAGAAIGSLYGDAGKGAVIGGIAGAAAGAVTDPCEVNLGNPVWRDQNATREDYYRRCGHYPPN